MGALRLFVDANIRLSRFIDGVLPRRLREDGNQTFLADYLPRSLQTGNTVYDLGGGSRPFVTLEQKQRLGLSVTGLDLSREELEAAPAGIYDNMIATDLCTYTGPSDADVVICQATLEHVPDTVGAMRAIASTVKPAFEGPWSRICDGQTLH